MLYDLIFAGIIILALWAGYRKGAVQSVLSLAVFAAAAVFAVVVTRPVSLLIYNTFIKAGIESRISGFIVESPTGGLLFKAAEYLATLPSMFLDLLGRMNVTDKISSEGADAFDSATAASTEIAGVIEPAITAVIGIIVFILLFVVFNFLLGLAAKAAANVFKLPLLRLTDSLLGAGFGFVKGIDVILAIFILLNLLQPFIGEYIGFVYSGLEDSAVYSLFEKWKVMSLVSNIIYGI